MATIRWTSRHARLSRRFFFLSFLFFLSFSYSCYKFMDGTEFYGCILFFHSFFFFSFLPFVWDPFSHLFLLLAFFFFSLHTYRLFLDTLGYGFFFLFILQRGRPGEGYFREGIGRDRDGLGGRRDDWTTGLGGGFFVNIGIWRRGGVSLLETSCVFSSSFLWFL